MYSAYVSGAASGNNFNLLVSGKDDYANSGISIKNDTTVGKGISITHTSSDNAVLDFRSDSGKALKIRLQDHANPSSAAEMLSLTNDDKSSTSTFGAVVGGRLKASQIHTSEADTRAPVASGVYLGHDAQNTGYVKINRGTKIGGFSFQTHNADGSLSKTHLELSPYGYVSLPEYKSSGDALDSEALAIASFDSQGRLVRDYKQNARMRSLEERTSSAEEDSSISIPSHINQVIRRMNSLEYFSAPITEMSLGTTSSAPVIYSGEIQLAASVDATTVDTSSWQNAFLQSIAESAGVSQSALSITAVSSSPAMSVNLRSATPTVAYIVVKVTSSGSVHPQTVMQRIKDQARDPYSRLAEKLVERQGGNPLNTNYNPVIRDLTPTAPTLNPTPISPAITARYIRWEFGNAPSTNMRYIHFREARVYSSKGGSDITTTGMTVTSSGAYHTGGYQASNIIDNNESTLFHSADGNLYPWLELDLGSEQPIYKIEVLNRGTAGLEERYAGIKVILKSSSGSQVWVSNLAKRTNGSDQSFSGMYDGYAYYSYWPGLGVNTYGSFSPLGDTPPQ
jgi:hypothetical protein